jgi:flagella basal body P-ring formation protein FlgA
MESLDAGRVMQAMLESLHSPGAHIEVAETSLAKVPLGRVEFPREMLGRPASSAQRDPVLWHGEVVYGDDHRFSIWAKVRINVPCRRAVAVEPLKAGQPIEPRQLRTEEGQCFPLPGNAAPIAPESLAGMLPAHAIAAGAEVRPEFVAPPNQVNRGDSVHVEVRSGAARLAFMAKAESGGREGDMIAVRNPSSNKVFRARIKGKDQVVVQTEFAGPGR